jgi:beta/gamma crystallin
MPRTFIGLAVALVLAAACGGGFQTLGPTPAGEGIIIYMHADFVGPSQAINVDVADLGRVEGSCSSGAEGETPTWASCVSSVKVMAGWTATLYQKPNFRGESVVLTSDTRNLKDLRGPCDKSTFNDCASSIRVARQ